MNPVAWWQALPPAVREPFRSFVVSTALGLQSTTVTAVGIGYIYGHCGTFADTVAYLETTWWFIILAAIFGIGPFYRAKQGATASANTVTLPSGATAVLTKGP